MPQVLSTTDIFTADVFPWQEQLKEEQTKSNAPITFPDDPVALSVASYNFWKRNNAGRWMDLSLVSVSHEDREQAIRLKKYYRDRLVIEALKGNGAEVSSFRQKLRQLVTDELVITHSELGMLYRLPYFYDEDQALDRVIAKTTSVPENAYKQGTETQATYTLLERVFRGRRSGEVYDYWLSSDQDPYLHVLALKSDNPLRAMFESIIAHPIKLNTREWTKSHYGYYRNRLYQQIVVQGIAND